MTSRNALALTLALAASASAATAAPGGQLLINEVDSDTVGTDLLEFVELYTTSGASVPLDGYVLVFYNGSSDTSYAAFDLDGFSTSVDGYFLVGNVDVVPTPGLIIPSNALQNGADAVALYLGDDTDFPSGTPVTATNLVDAVVYDTSDADDTGLLDVLTPGMPQLDEAANGDKDFESVQRCLNGAGGALNTAQWITQTASPGTECTFTPTLLINEVDSDSVGTDLLEFVELWDTTGGSVPLDPYVVVFYNGSSDTSYAAYDLDGFTTDSAGYFLIGNVDVVPTPGLIIPSNGIQNGADAIALYLGEAVNFPNGTPVTNVDLVDAVVYGTADADDPGLLDVLTPGMPQLDEDALGNKDFDSVQRCPNGAGGALDTTQWIAQTASPAAECSQAAVFTSYCVAFPNSVSGGGALMDHTGSGSIAANDTVLVCNDVPNNFGLFYFGDTQAFQLPFGNGVQCVAQPFNRLGPIVGVSGNVASRALDFAGAGPENQITALSSWNFQYWYRDPGQGIGWNTSDGLNVVFAP